MRDVEISHFSHPQHKLKSDYTEIPFKCEGCKEVGIGCRYRCCGGGGGGACDFDLHAQCALATAAPITHPFYRKCRFEFMERPKGKVRRYCNACEKDVKGFVYHCTACGFDLHPCCLFLPLLLDDNEDLKLSLYPKAHSPCLRCGRKGRSWTYRSSCKKYNVHVACVREMLVENWREVYKGQNGKTAGGSIPSLKNTLQHHHHHRSSSKGKVQKCCEIAGIAVQFVISAVLGDPTAIIAGVVGSLISRA